MEYILKNSIGYRINKVASNINTCLNKLLIPYDIGIEQRATLEIIKFEPNANQTTIAQLLGKDKTTISRTLNALEKKGFIIKDDIQNDKRVNVIKLTQKGEAILEESLEEIKNFREKLTQTMSTLEIEMLFNSLDKIALTLSKDSVEKAH
jgi:DNA-binding MarR family transcriptional regulator